MNKKILTATLAAVLGSTVLGGAALAAEEQEANLPVKVDEKTGVISSNGPAEVATAGEKGEVYPVDKTAKKGKGAGNIEYKGKAVLDKDGNLQYVKAHGPANVQEALPEFKGELPKLEKEKQPASKKQVKTLPKTSAVK